VRRPGAGLIDVDDELVAESAGKDLVGGGDNRARDVGVEAPERGVGLRRRFLDEDGARDEIGMRAQTADRKVLDGARRSARRSTRRRARSFAEWIALDAVRHGHVSGVRGWGLGASSGSREQQNLLIPNP
jgi:hypothetical protein